tara:strand:- start:120 stop:530 length:411 start_codon:yes stop_codon:yes gene_type:complete
MNFKSKNPHCPKCGTNVKSANKSRRNPMSNNLEGTYVYIVMVPYMEERNGGWIAGVFANEEAATYCAREQLIDPDPEGRFEVVVQRHFVTDTMTALVDMQSKDKGVQRILKQREKAEPFTSLIDEDQDDSDEEVLT